MSSRSSSTRSSWPEVLVRITDAGRDHGQIFAPSTIASSTFGVRRPLSEATRITDVSGALADDARSVELEFDIVNRSYPEGRTSYTDCRDLLPPNAAEATALTGYADPEAWRRCRQAEVRPRSARTAARDRTVRPGRSARTPSSVTAVVHTGVGDAFAAGLRRPASAGAVAVVRREPVKAQVARWEARRVMIDQSIRGPGACLKPSSSTVRTDQALKGSSRHARRRPGRRPDGGRRAPRATGRRLLDGHV